MKRLSVILVNSKYDIKTSNKEIEIIKTTSSNLKETIYNAKGKYISFICNEDEISDNYLDVVYNKTFEEFDSSFINYKLNYPNIVMKRDNKHFNHLSNIRPLYLEYIFNFLFKRSKLLKILDLKYDSNFDDNVSKIIKTSTAIMEEIYIHNPVKNENSLSNLPYIDYKECIYYKNIIYIKYTLTAKFNGIITWLINIGKVFGKKYDITIMYEDIYNETKERLKEYFNVVKRENYINYLCDNFITTYLDYFIPLNVNYYKESSTFVTGVMIENDCLYPDVYDRYIGVSKVCSDSIRFGFETDYKPEYIHNPIKIDKKSIKPHLKLVSTLRSEECKGLKRLEKISEILDELEIPYTWNVFTDINEGTNHSGFIYRNSVNDPMPYIKDADYLVMLSDIESFCYSVIESLLLNTKVVVTPIDVFKEIGVVENENGIVIPFEYFEEENKDKLKEKVLEIYNNKDKKIDFKETKLNYLEFSKLLK